MRILLTGFEPFDGLSSNPSQDLTLRLASSPPTGVDLCTTILPVDYLHGPAILLEACQAEQPQAVVCTGVAPRRAAISVERVAVNLIDARIPDNAGQTWTDRPVRAGGPAAYFSTLPVREIVAAALQVGVPAELSLSAGAFLCNQVMYTLLDWVAQNGSIPAGFIHLPYAPREAAEVRKLRPEQPLYPSMALEVMELGLRSALQVLAEKTER